MGTLPDLTESLHPTLESAHLISRLAGRVRRELTSAHPHWWHVSLSIEKNEISSGSISDPVDSSAEPFSIAVDLSQHQLVLRDRSNPPVEWGLTGLRIDQLRDDVVRELKARGHSIVLDQEEFGAEAELAYDPSQGATIFAALKGANDSLRSFRQTTSDETSPVQLWPHHFDLAFVRFTGRLAPGIDPADLDSSREQVNHGFTFGDEAVAEPYFYVVPYPLPDRLTPSGLHEARLVTKGFTGYVLPWKSYAAVSDPAGLLKSFLADAQDRLKDVMEG